MALRILTTGLENYLPGGGNYLKVLVLGITGSGKTTFASWAPKPIFAACEAGLSSVARKRLPFGEVNTSQDMIELLEMLKVDSRRPSTSRQYQTLCWDTVDGLQRKIKLEWCEISGKSIFEGRSAWAHLDSKMNAILTRVINLQMNVVATAHLRDKVIRDDEDERETHEYMIRVQGSLGDTLPDEFDIVGLAEKRWTASEGQRTEERVLTFTSTPKFPMLKNRLGIQPSTFVLKNAQSDWDRLYSGMQQGAEGLLPMSMIEEVPSLPDNQPSAVAVTPAQTKSGPVPPQPAAIIDYRLLDKKTLVTLCRERGVDKLETGMPISGNTIKAELVQALIASDGRVAQRKSGEAPAAAVVQPVAADVPPAAPLEQVADGVVNTETGELVKEATPEQQHDQAVAVVASTLGGTVIEEAVEEPVAPPAPERTPTAADAIARRQGPPASDAKCEECQKDIGPGSGENVNYIRVARIRYRGEYCNACFFKKRDGKS